MQTPVRASFKVTDGSALQSEARASMSARPMRHADPEDVDSIEESSSSSMQEVEDIVIPMKVQKESGLDKFFKNKNDASRSRISSQDMEPQPIS